MRPRARTKRIIISGARCKVLTTAQKRRVSFGIEEGLKQGKDFYRCWKAVIFDMDGTICDSFPLMIRALREAVEPIVDMRYRMRIL